MKMVWSDTIDNLLKNGLSLKEIGVNNWALRKNDALKVLQKFEEMQVAILGGDVCELKDGIIQYNYDSWHCDRLKEESDHDFVMRSIQDTKRYIEVYTVTNDDKIFFAFVPQLCKSGFLEMP